MQFYSGNHLDDGIQGKEAARTSARMRFVLKRSTFADSPTTASFHPQ